MSDPQLVVMAAGIGSRYGGLKQVEPIGPGGEILTDYALFDAHRAGFRRVVFVIRRDIEQAFHDRIGARVARTFDMGYAFQELDKLPKGYAAPGGRSKPWGTGHAILCARDAIDAPFAVINADDFYGAESFRNLYEYLLGARDRDGVYDFCMVGYRLVNTLSEHGHVARGICTAASDGTLETIVERTKIRPFDGGPQYEDADGTWVRLPADSLVSMNMFGFTPAFMGELGRRFPLFLKDHINEPKAEFFLPTVVNQLIEEKKARVKILPTADRWRGVTYREDTQAVREAIHELVKNGVYPENVWG
ncbi:MAG: nucleotidyltransferase [Chitinivibrionales bacterium]|nr:nucleotidyltransferase [Chitinivibrionales bacterium]MBD3395794.1 nucleotidyltransferase [Chitinivibrionales bacterium]